MVKSDVDGPRLPAGCSGQAGRADVTEGYPDAREGAGCILLGLEAAGHKLLDGDPYGLGLEEHFVHGLRYRHLDGMTSG